MSSRRHVIACATILIAATLEGMGAQKAAQAKIVSEPEDKPWKLREFMAADLDGNLIRVFYDFRGDM